MGHFPQLCSPRKAPELFAALRLGYPKPMEQDRIDAAIARMERALARAEAAARRAGAAESVGPNPALVRQHEALRKSVSASLEELDALIGALDR